LPETAEIVVAASPGLTFPDPAVVAAKVRTPEFALAVPVQFAIEFPAPVLAKAPVVPAVFELR